MSAGNETIVETLVNSGYSFRFCSFTALDNYLGLPSFPFVFLETNTGIADLARLAEDLYFPGADIADCATDSGGRRWYFRCREPGEAASHLSYGILSLVQDPQSRRFFDARGIYPQIRALRKVPRNKTLPEANMPGWWEDLEPGAGYFRALMDGALILARYEAAKPPPSGFIEGLGFGIGDETPPGPENQQVLLTGLLASPCPERGFELLKEAGFLEKIWPELARLDGVDHSKEFHPEGNAWKHTLQTFEHRKQNASGEYDPLLSLALLLHDIGKPLAEVSGSRRFDGHAELGAYAARRFLERLEFGPSLIEDVFYLVKNHMLPAALARLPLMKTGGIMSSPLFPTLMELYRCDESSSFKGLEGYYENSAAYQAYLRNIKNPFRSADGRKLTNSKHRSYHK